MAWVHRYHAGTATGVAHTAWAWLATLLAQVLVLGSGLEVAPLHLSFGWHHWTHCSWPLPELSFLKTWHHSGEQAKTPRGRWVEKEGADNRTWLLSGVDSPSPSKSHMDHISASETGSVLRVCSKCQNITGHQFTWFVVNTLYKSNG